MRQTRHGPAAAKLRAADLRGKRGKRKGMNSNAVKRPAKIVRRFTNLPAIDAEVAGYA